MAKVETTSMIKEIINRLVEPPLLQIEQNFSRMKETIVGELSATQALLNTPSRNEVCNETINELSELVSGRIQEVEASLGDRLSALVLNGQKVLTGSSQSEILAALLSGATHFSGRIVLFLSRGDNLVGWKGAGTAYTSDPSSVATIQINKADEANIVAGAYQQQSPLHNDFSSSENAFLNQLEGRTPDTVTAVPILVGGKCPAVLFADYHSSDANPFNYEALIFLTSLAQNKIELQTLSRTVQKAGISAYSTIELTTIHKKPPAEPLPDATTAPLPKLEPPAAKQTVPFSHVAPESVPSMKPVPVAEPIVPAISFVPPVLVAEPIVPTIPSVPPVPVAESAEQLPISEISYSAEPIEVVTEPVDATPFNETESTFLGSITVLPEEKPDTIPIVPILTPTDDVAPVFSFTPEHVQEDMQTVQFKMSMADLISKDKMEIPPASSAVSPADSIPMAEPVIEPPVVSEKQSASSFIAGLQIPSSAPPMAGLTSQVASSADRLHSDARRFARLLVSEIKLYNETALHDARKNRNVYSQLKKTIDLSREHYSKRIAQSGVPGVDYFHQELVRMLCDGDGSLLGKDYPGPTEIG